MNVCRDFVLIVCLSLSVLNHTYKCVINSKKISQDTLYFCYSYILHFCIRRKKLFKLFKTPLQPLHLETGNDVIMTYSTSNRYQEGTADPQMPTSPLSNCPVEYIHMIDGQFTVKMSPVEFLRYIDQKQNEELLLKSLVVGLILQLSPLGFFLSLL